MHYIGIVFEVSGGKTLEAKIFEADNFRSLADKASFYGFNNRVTDVLYRAGNFQGLQGKAMAVMGPYTTQEVAQSMAYSIHAAALTVDTAKYLIELTQRQAPVSA